MARPIPILSRRALERSSQDDPFVVFVTITHPTMTDVINLVIDGADYVWDDVTYAKSYFELELLTDIESPPEAKFSFPNVNRSAITKLRKVVSPCRVEFKIVSGSYFNMNVEPRVVKDGLTVETLYEAHALFLTEIKADQIMVEGRLRSWDYRQEQWPDKRVTKSLLPGVYAR